MEKKKGETPRLRELRMADALALESTMDSAPEQDLEDRERELLNDVDSENLQDELDEYKELVEKKKKH